MTVLLREAHGAADACTTALAQQQRLLLPAVDWQCYLALGRALADRPGLRLTYDRGNLEFMTTSPEHEIYKKHLTRFIEILAEEFNRPFATAGQMTFQKETLSKGLEADDCFWFEHEPAMRGKLTWDARIDPPPDLGLEIEISRSVLDRLGMYAALRIGEIWCFDGRAVRIQRLQADGSYQQADASQVFPSLPVAEVARFLEMARTMDVLSVIRAFRQWVRTIVQGKSSP